MLPTTYKHTHAPHTLVPHYCVPLQSVYCYSMPHIVHFAVGVIALIVFVILAGFSIMGEREVRADGGTSCWECKPMGWGRGR